MMAQALAQPVQTRFPAYAGFAAVLSAAGLPIYIFAPKYYADTFGVSLAAIGVALFALRLIDVVQDPMLGWLAERLRRGRALVASLVAAGLALSMLALFAVQPPIAAIWWFALSMAVLFSCFSFLTILFYAQGIAKAGESPGNGHLRLAAWRESGALTGICLAAIAPTVLALWSGAPFAAFAVLFAVGVLLAARAMWPEWRQMPERSTVSVSEILADRPARSLLLLALVNALPLAISSTLFLFFVERRLEAPGWEGPLLVLFFLAAAISAPVWSRLAQRFGVRPVLLSAMLMAIVVFGWAVTLGAGDTTAFAVICILSGATIGADMTLMPAAFARRMSRIAPNGGQGFGLWSFVSKFTLAFAAIALLPLIDAPVAADAVLTEGQRLSLLYAALPCLMKLIAVGLLAITPLEEE